MRKNLDNAEEHLEPPQVPKGWSSKDWAKHLRKLAATCKAYRPEIAEKYEKWATMVEDSQ